MAEFSPEARYKEVIRVHYTELGNAISSSSTVLMSVSSLFYQHRFIDQPTKDCINRAGGLYGANMLLDQVQLKLKHSEDYLPKFLAIVKEVTALTDIADRIEDFLCMKFENGTSVTDKEIHSALKSHPKCSEEQKRQASDFDSTGCREEMNNLEFDRKPVAQHFQKSQRLSETSSVRSNSHFSVEAPEDLIDNIICLSGDYDKILSDIQFDIEQKVASQKLELNRIAKYVSQCLNRIHLPLDPNKDTLNSIFYPLTQELSFIDPNLDLLRKLDKQYCDSHYKDVLQEYSFDLKKFLKESTAITDFVHVMKDKRVSLRRSEKKEHHDAQIIIRVSDLYGKRTVDDVLKLKEKIFSGLDIGLVTVHQSILTLVYSIPEGLVTEAITIVEEVDKQLLKELGVISIQVADTPPLVIVEVDEGTLSNFADHFHKSSDENHELPESSILKDLPAEGMLSLKPDWDEHSCHSKSRFKNEITDVLEVTANKPDESGLKSHVMDLTIDRNVLLVGLAGVGMSTLALVISSDSASDYLKYESFAAGIKPPVSPFHEFPTSSNIKIARGTIEPVILQLSKMELFEKRKSLLFGELLLSWRIIHVVFFVVDAAELKKNVSMGKPSIKIRCLEKYISTLREKERVSDVSALVITKCDTVEGIERSTLVKNLHLSFPMIANFMKKGIFTTAFPQLETSRVFSGVHHMKSIEEDKNTLMKVIEEAEHPVHFEDFTSGHGGCNLL